jgi:hypothetical protein
LFASLVLLFAAQQPWAEIANEADLSIAPYYSVQCDTSDSDFFYVLITQRRARFDSAAVEAASDVSDRKRASLRAHLIFANWKIYSEYSDKYWSDIADKLVSTQPTAVKFTIPPRAEISVELIETSEDRLAFLHGFPKAMPLKVTSSPLDALIQGALFEVLVVEEEYDLIDKSALLDALISRRVPVSFWLGMRLCELLANDGRQKEAQEAFALARNLPSVNSWRDLSAYSVACSSLDNMEVPRGLNKLLGRPRNDASPEDSRLKWLTSDPRLGSLPFGSYSLQIDASEYVVVASYVTLLNGEFEHAEWLMDAVEERLFDRIVLDPEVFDLAKALEGVLVNPHRDFLADPSEWQSLSREAQQGEQSVKYSFIHIARLSSSGGVVRPGSATQIHNTFVLNTSDFSNYAQAKSELRRSAIRHYCDSRLPGWFSEVNLSMIDLESTIPEVWLLFGEHPKWHVGFNDEGLNSALSAATRASYLSMHAVVEENHLLSQEQTFDLVNNWWAQQGSAFSLASEPTSNGLELKIRAIALADTTGSEPSKFAGRPEKQWAVAEASLLIELPMGATVTIPVRSGKKYFGAPPNPKILAVDIASSLEEITLDNMSKLEASFFSAIRERVQKSKTNNP